MHHPVLCSHQEKFDDDDFNSFQAIAFEGNTYRQTHTQTRVIYITKSKSLQTIKMYQLKVDNHGSKSNGTIITLKSASCHLDDPV